MRLLIHDFAGHPFQIQLSRELATRGHLVTHVYAAGLSGPKGQLSKDTSDPPGLSICGIQLPSQFQKYSAHRRFCDQRNYTKQLKSLRQHLKRSLPKFATLAVPTIDRLASRFDSHRTQPRRVGSGPAADGARSRSGDAHRQGGKRERQMSGSGF